MTGIIYTGEDKSTLIDEIESSNYNIKIFVEPTYQKEFEKKILFDHFINLSDIMSIPKFYGIEITSTHKEYINSAKELTIADIAKKFGTTPDKIKIIDK